MVKQRLLSFLMGAAMLAGVEAILLPRWHVSSAAQAKNWLQDPEWVKARYGPWDAPDSDMPPGPMDSILLRDYAPKTSLVVPQTFVAKAKYPVIDVHAHPELDKPEEIRQWVRTLDEVGVQTTVLLSGATGAKFDRLVELYLKPYPGRFQLYCGLATADNDKPDYPQRAVAELLRCYTQDLLDLYPEPQPLLPPNAAPDIPHPHAVNHDT